MEFVPHLRSDVTATLSNLSACTNYEFEVASVSTTDEISSAAVQYMETDYTRMFKRPLTNAINGY